jgi:hypothetical protein
MFDKTKLTPDGVMFKVPVQIGKTIVLGRNFLNTIG